MRGVRLEVVGRALAFGAVQAPDAGLILEFSKAAEVAIEVERALHAGFLTQFGVDPAEAERAAPSPTCQAYVDSLIAAAATGGFAWAAAALYAGCNAWVVGYDTIYALQDREDDALVGIGSSAPP